MAGTSHRRLVELLITRIRALGYRVIASDQWYPVLGESHVPAAPTILRHSPDVLGARAQAPILCIGEAKTTGDVRTRHTQQQLRDFATCPDCLVIVAIPLSGLAALETTLYDLEIRESPMFQVMAVPDELIRS